MYFFILKNVNTTAIIKNWFLSWSEKDRWEAAVNGLKSWVLIWTKCLGDKNENIMAHTGGEALGKQPRLSAKICESSDLGVRIKKE